MKKNKEKHVSKKVNNSIYQAKDGKEYVITSAPELGLLRSLGIVKDKSIHKRMTYRLGGPVLIMVESSEIAIGKDIAEQILVRG